MEKIYTDSQQRKEVIGRIRKKILTAAYKSSDGHIPSSFSIVELLYGIFIDFPKIYDLKFDKEYEFILSKGHAALAIYAFLEEISLIDDSWINTFSLFESNYGGHPDSNKVPQVGASTGSLGHGLPIAVGKTLANRALGKFKKIFCLVGDGELNEGSIWESLMLVAHHNLFELIIILDSNHSSDRALVVKNLNKVIENLGFNLIEINGHSQKEINESFEKLNPKQPNFILAHTTKGFGIKEMENNPVWHHLSPNAENFERLLESIE